MQCALVINLYYSIFNHVIYSMMVCSFDTCARDSVELFIQHASHIGGIPTFGAREIHDAAETLMGWRRGMRFAAQRQQVGIRLSRHAVLTKGGPREGAQDGGLGLQVWTVPARVSEGPRRAGIPDTALTCTLRTRVNSVHVFHWNCVHMCLCLCHD